MAAKTNPRARQHWTNIVTQDAICATNDLYSHFQPFNSSERQAIRIILYVMETKFKRVLVS